MISTSLVTLPMHASFHFINYFLWSSIHHTSMDIEFKTYAMQANICKCTYKCNIQVYELAPPARVLQLFIDPFTMSFYFFTIFVNSLPLCQQLIQKVSSNFRKVGVKPCEVRIIFPIWFNLDLLQKIFNSIWPKDKLLHTSK